MFVKNFRRRSHRRLLNNGLLLIGFLLLLDLWSILNSYKTFVANLSTNTVTRLEDLPSRARNQKIYIVAQFWTSADVLTEYWVDCLIDLVNTLGPENVYLSILGSKGLDNTDEVLQWMDQRLEQLHVPRTIIIDPASHKDAIDIGPVDEQGNARPGWILTGDSHPPGQKELRRIPFLANLRNRGLLPLKTLREEKGITYDKILYLNDVKFSPSDVLSLLATNGGIYDVACAMDFQYPPDFYDTFVLRDSNHATVASRRFPYFRSSTSRGAMIKGAPAPVSSCWNGIMLAEAAPYYDKTAGKITTPPQLPGGSASHAITLQSGLQFRGIPDTLASSHLEASECCLIHADLIARNQAKKGIYINPAVRVGYNEQKSRNAYDLVHTGPKGLGFVTLNQYVGGIWRTRFDALVRPAWWDMRDVNRRVEQWKRTGHDQFETWDEVGAYCIIDEMQILIWNGWKHVW